MGRSNFISVTIFDDAPTPKGKASGAWPQSSGLTPSKLLNLWRGSSPKSWPADFRASIFWQKFKIMPGEPLAELKSETMPSQLLNPFAELKPANILGELLNPLAELKPAIMLGELLNPLTGLKSVIMLGGLSGPHSEFGAEKRQRQRDRKRHNGSRRKTSRGGNPQSNNPEENFAIFCDVYVSTTAIRITI